MSKFGAFFKNAFQKIEDSFTDTKAASSKEEQKKTPPQ
jgi:hypothetical protein